MLHCGGLERSGRRLRLLEVREREVVVGLELWVRDQVLLAQRNGHEFVKGQDAGLAAFPTC
jgi:hypothetical protein